MIRAFLILIVTSCLTYGEDLIKVVFRTIEPPVPAESFAAKPKTLYRQGPTKGRVEEEPDPALKLHGLIISNEKDIWMINLWDKTGKHIIDPGPTYNFHASIVPPTEHNKPPKVDGFQIGYELSFMKGKGILSKEANFMGEKALLYECTEDGLLLKVYVSPTSFQPVGVSVEDGKKALTTLRYDEYLASAPPDDTLFVPPQGIRLFEQK